MTTTRQAIGVLISDIHYNLVTLSVADAAMRQAIAKANSLSVPLIVCGDTHDTKANLRGECIKAMIETFKLAKISPIVVVGNHDRLHEKNPEHSLEFLRPYTTIVDKPIKNLIPYWWFLPYFHDSAELKALIKTIPMSTNIILHQGLVAAKSGEYMLDKSALSQEDVSGLRCISGHYHERQTIALPNGGTWDYVGNPFSLNFGEANHPEKGYQILYDDGSLEFVSTNLRKHIIKEYKTLGDTGYGGMYEHHTDKDIIWVKLSGTTKELSIRNKAIIASALSITQDFRLELIPTDTVNSTEANKQLQSGELIDSLIDTMTGTNEDRKMRLKSKWKTLCES